MKRFLLILAVVVFLTPFVAWAMYKPMRVLAPSWVEGVSCMDSNICIDDKSRYSEALHLYENAVQSVSETVGLFHNKPTVIFCANMACYNSFGFNKSSGRAVGRSGIVISQRGWKPYYVRHEMIHHRQAEELGVFAALFKPEWLIEGMAYSLSYDPRNTLSARWQQARSKFNSWLREVGADNLWEEARKL
jgi:hypothetical protein